MQLYSFKISLRIWHPSINPDVITEKLGLKPQNKSFVGQPRKTPKGNPLDGVYAESYWSSDPFNYGEILSSDTQIEDAIEELCDFLKPHKEFLLSLKEEKSYTCIEIASFGSRNYAFILPPRLMIKCSDLGLSFAHDVYPYAQTW